MEINLKVVREKGTDRARKNLFLEGFDQQLVGVKNNDIKIVEAILPKKSSKKRIS